MTPTNQLLNKVFSNDAYHGLIRAITHNFPHFLTGVDNKPIKVLWRNLLSAYLPFEESYVIDEGTYRDYDGQTHDILNIYLYSEQINLSIDKRLVMTVHILENKNPDHTEGECDIMVIERYLDLTLPVNTYIRTGLPVYFLRVWGRNLEWGKYVLPASGADEKVFEPIKIMPGGHDLILVGNQRSFDDWLVRTKQKIYDDFREGIEAILERG